LYFTDEDDRRDGAGREAVDMAERLGDPPTQLVALYSRHWSMLGPDGLEERRRAAEELVRIAERVGDREMAYRGHHMRLRTALELDDIATVDAALEACAALADELRQPFYVWQTAVFRASRAIAEGPLAEGEKLALEAFQIGQRVSTELATTALGVLIGIHRALVGRAEEILARVKDRAESLPGEPAWRAAFAWCSAEAGQHAEARAEVDTLATAGFARMPRNGNWITGVHMLGRTCAILGEAGWAEELYDLLLPYAGRTAITGSIGAPTPVFSVRWRPRWAVSTRRPLTSRHPSGVTPRPGRAAGW
jgi:hypothetical protein